MGERKGAKEFKSSGDFTVNDDRGNGTVVSGGGNADQRIFLTNEKNWFRRQGCCGMSILQ